VAAAVLDGLNAASLALMAVVTWQLAVSAIVDPLSLLIAAAALVLMRYRVNSTWAIAGGALAGLIARGGLR
jgi:chromate transporter